MEYYKAYEKRYKQVHKENELWTTTLNTKEILNVIEDYNINKESSILDLGCGEGRDSIYLLNNGYNVLGIDYSKEAIDTCKKIADERFKSNFKQFDLIEDKLDNKFDFIYSIAVLHMFVKDNHRDGFYKCIYNNLKENGLAFVVVMGDGIKEYESDITKAFENQKRINLTTGKEMTIASTSCKVVNWNNLEKEIELNGLKIIEKWISNDIPEFESCMCIVIKK